jgi:hypothetical protein
MEWLMVMSKTFLVTVWLLGENVSNRGSNTTYGHETLHSSGILAYHILPSFVLLVHFQTSKNEWI